MPWLQTPTIFDIRTRPRSISSITGTKDLQMVNITLRVLSKPNVDMLPEIYKVRHLSYPNHGVQLGRDERHPSRGPGLTSCRRPCPSCAACVPEVEPAATCPSVGTKP